MIRYDSAASYDHGTGPAPRAWRVARDLQIPVRELTGMELAAAVLDSLMADRREREALRDGDVEGARIQAEIARDYEMDADFWAQVGDDDGPAATSPAAGPEAAS